MAPCLNEPLDFHRLRHPVFDAVRVFVESVAAVPAAARLGKLNALAASAGIRTASGRQLRFDPVPARTSGYEQQVFETGVVPTRNGNVHDLFNAVAWLAFPRTKAAMNRLHVEAQRRPDRGSGHARGPLRDLLTVLDESGAIVSCSDAIAEDIVSHRWRSLFWDGRERLANEFHIAVIGHAVLEKALDPWPGITCKVIIVSGGERDLDAAASSWLDGLLPRSGPRLLSPLPVFGLPGWLPGTSGPQIYDDKRWFRD